MTNANRISNRAPLRTILRASIAISALAALVNIAYAWDIGWISQFGSGRFTNSEGGGRVDATGVYTVGSTFPALPGQVLVGGSTDAYIRKFAFDGTILW